MTSDELLQLAQTHFKTAEDLLVELARIPSVTPPSDTRLIARFVFDRLKSLSGVTCEIVSEVQPIDNVRQTSKMEQFFSQAGTGVTGFSLWLHSKKSSGFKTRWWLKSAEPVGRS